LRFKAWQCGWIRWRGEEGDGPDKWGQLVGKRGETRRQGERHKPEMENVFVKICQWRKGLIGWLRRWWIAVVDGPT
jgi:hypothetical protein